MIRRLGIIVNQLQPHQKQQQNFISFAKQQGGNNTTTTIAAPFRTWNQSTHYAGGQNSNHAVKHNSNVMKYYASDFKLLERLAMQYLLQVHGQQQSRQLSCTKPSQYYF